MRLWKIKYSDEYDYGSGWMSETKEGYFCSLDTSLEGLHKNINAMLGKGHHAKVIQALYVGECSPLGAGEFRDGQVFGA
jgi:hypothetical protein